MRYHSDLWRQADIYPFAARVDFQARSASPLGLLGKLHEAHFILYANKYPPDVCLLEIPRTADSEMEIWRYGEKFAHSRTSVDPEDVH